MYNLKERFILYWKRESIYGNFDRIKRGESRNKKEQRKFKMKRGMLVIHKDGQDTDLDYWRTVIPDNTSVKNFVVTELHAVPYSIHPGMQRT